MSGHSGFSLNVEALPTTFDVLSSGEGAFTTSGAPVKIGDLAATETSPRNTSVESTLPPTVGGLPQPRTLIHPASPARSSAATFMASTASTIRRPSSPFNANASPSRGMRQSSPRHLSPATSQIFERDVQEPTISADLAPAIPAHMVTEDHIPAVLEASSLAITDSHLNPDDVEIVTHAGHQPAAAIVGGVGGHSDMHNMAASPSPMHAHLQSELGMHAAPERAENPYGAGNPLDPRRLSFVSFADVMHAEQAEHAESGKDAAHAPGYGHGHGHGFRSPSPSKRLRVADRTAMLPPARKGSASVSPSRAGASSAGGAHGELTIETMRQTMQEAVHKERGGSVSH